MGKRKKSSRKPMGKKRNDPLPTVFTCLFCNHENSVTVKIDKKGGVGSLECKVCGQRFQCTINYLSAAVDVYGEWVDAAEAVAKGEGDTATEQHLGEPSRGATRKDRRTANDSDGEPEYSGEGIVADDDDY
ncbi:hypothetical protein VSDG_07205 [Cytospora chrysosperma]|uniref:Transcription elongation factor 1 homolog n=1 Tax=Cytospora chrysosperma TaxID=252740 RepID=A0A423VKE7_CYTCH|nr:hypothetical protein VSDG_07205 [Valsa sordida]